MEQTVWIARHGNRLDFVFPEWFNTAEFRYDPPLSEDGMVQAKELGQRLKSENIKFIFASPFLRAIQTAYAVAEVLDLPIFLEAGLSEWLNADWMVSHPQLNPITIIAQKYPRLDLSYNSRVVPQYPESLASVDERTGLTARKLAAEFSANILLVGHGASVSGAARGLLMSQEKINAPLCCLVKLVRRGDRWQMELNGDVSHLSGKQSPIRFN